MPHFCTCDDHDCPLNPNNPKNLAAGRGCDRCIQKNIALGEVPSCIFNALGPTEGWDDWSVEGFARFVALHPRDEETRRLCHQKAAAFDQAHSGHPGSQAD